MILGPFKNFDECIKKLPVHTRSKSPIERTERMVVKYFPIVHYLPVQNVYFLATYTFTSSSEIFFPFEVTIPVITNTSLKSSDVSFL